MRLTRDQIEYISHRIVHDLQRDGFCDISDPREVEEAIRQVIVEELSVEDRLNEEVREVMRQHMDQIRRADVEYHSMFKAIKAKLAKERDIIL